MNLNIQDFFNVGINKLYHLTYLENIDSILKNNILSRSKQEKMNITPTNYSNLEIVSKLQEKHLNIDDFVPLFFNKNTPMLYELKHKTDKLLILELDISELSQNAKSNWNRSFFSNKNYLSIQNPMKDSRLLYDYPIIIFSEIGWQSNTQTDHYKLEAQSEFLFYQEIPIQSINVIHVDNFNVKSEVEKKISNLNKKINIEIDDFNISPGRLNDKDIVNRYYKEYQRLQAIRKSKNILTNQEVSDIFKMRSRKHRLYLEKVLRSMKLSTLEINKLKVFFREQANEKYTERFANFNHNKLQKQKAIINLQRTELSNYIKKEIEKLKNSSGIK